MCRLHYGQHNLFVMALFKQIAANKSHILHYLLPAEHDTELISCLRLTKAFPTVHAWTTVLKIHNLFYTDWKFSMPLVVLISNYAAYGVCLNSALLVLYSNKGCCCFVILYISLLTYLLEGGCCCLSVCLNVWLAVWCSGNALVSINAVALHRARLVLGWVTAFGQVNCLIT